MKAITIINSKSAPTDTDGISVDENYAAFELVKTVRK